MSHRDPEKAAAHNKKLAAKKKHILNSEMREVEEEFHEAEESERIMHTKRYRF